jgi:hypothetical protein
MLPTGTSSNIIALASFLLTAANAGSIAIKDMHANITQVSVTVDQYGNRTYIVAG